MKKQKEVILKVRSEFEGMIISKPIFNLGTVTFNKEVDPKYFANYQKLGFDLFEIVKPVKVGPKRVISEEHKEKIRLAFQKRNQLNG